MNSIQPNVFRQLERVNPSPAKVKDLAVEGAIAADAVAIGQLPVISELKSLEPLNAVQPTASAVKPTSLKKTAEQSAHASAFGGVLNSIWAGAMSLCKPIKKLLDTKDFALNFLGSMRTRANEITQSHGQVESQLKAKGLHDDYIEPKNHANVKLQGKMTIKTNMAEFFELWNSWIEHGYGSTNDRQYADLILQFRDQVQDLPLLRHVPMTSEDAFTVEVQDGKMQSMVETTTTKFAGVIPTSRVDWVYQRNTDPTASNSFEKKIDDFNGDIGALQQFYQDLFDPKKVNPNSTATVDFQVVEVDSIPEVKPSPYQYQHSVHVPLAGLFPRPLTTLDAKHLASTTTGLASQGVPAGLAGATALREHLTN